MTFGERFVHSYIAPAESVDKDVDSTFVNLGGSCAPTYEVLQPYSLACPWEIRKQGLAQGNRRALARLSEGLVRLGLARQRVAACCRVRWQPRVDLMLDSSAPEACRAYFRGLVTCASVWECPRCANKIRAERAEEIKQLVGHHGQARVLMLTLTVRHGVKDAFGRVLQGANEAWKLFNQGREWKPLKDSWGIVGFTRALETTHGENGWHPHHHILVYLENPFSDEQIEALRVVLSARWQRAVGASLLGASHLPDDVHGCDLRPVHVVDYLSKLGLEMVDLGTKQGRKGSRTPFQIAADVVAAGGRKEKDVALWREYCSGIAGARFLSHTAAIQAMRKELGLRATDEEVAAQEEPEREEPECLTSFDSVRWSAICCFGLGRVAVLEAAEEGGLHQVELLVEMMEFALDVEQEKQEGSALLSGEAPD